MHIALFFLLASLTALAQARPLLTATCGEPVGSRFDEVNGKMQENKDGYAGVNPIFILDNEKPGKLVFIWGSAKAGAYAGGSAPGTMAREATIISSNDSKVTAVAVEDEAIGVVHLYSLYPAKGLVFYTQHRYLPGGVPNSATYYARCKISTS